MKQRVILGIGNPGPDYEGTRHNIGWEVLDKLASGSPYKDGKSINAETAEVRVKNATLLLVKPQTYVNLSGEVIPALRRRFEEELNEILLVVCDDVNLPLGKLRIRRSGSSGGHNGLESLIGQLGTGFARLRVGVDRAAGLKDHVLSRFTPDEELVVDEAINRAAGAVRDWALSGAQVAMNRYNPEPKSSNDEESDGG